jgi:transcriptional regulator with XRE-family HTH domain
LKLPRLKEVRELHGWSQTKLAEESDVSRDSISNYETGQREAYPATAKKLADALNVEIAELIEPAREPALPKAEAPPPSGPPSIIAIAWDVARRQVAREKRGGEIAGTPNIIDQRHENEAARRLREEHGLDGNDAEALVDFALECARLEEENAMLRDRLQERERAHS